MSYEDNLKERVQNVLNQDWMIRDGVVVPEAESIALSNGAVRLDATYLYADMAGSSRVAQQFEREKAAKIIKSFVNPVSDVINHYGGEIRSFDGDRVMGIFVGDSKNSSAGKAALAIKHTVDKIVRPKLVAKWPAIENTYTMSHGVGIATGTALLVRGGIRGLNDIISVGEAPNVAAKLSDIRRTDNQRSFITKAVYDKLNRDAKYNGDVDMWSKIADQTVGGKTYTVYGSGYTWLGPK
jgi:adenylate cyclase